MAPVGAGRATTPPFVIMQSGRPAAAPGEPSVPAGRRDVPAVASAVGRVARPTRSVLGQAVAWRGACTSKATRITECGWTTTDAP